MRTPVKWKRAPIRASAGSTRSNLPAETPPEMSSRSASIASRSALSSASRRIGGRRQHPGLAAGSRHQRRQHRRIRVANLARAGLSIHRHKLIACGENRYPGRVKTSSEAYPQAAASAICAGPSLDPGGSSTSPLCACAPCATMLSPASIVRGGSSGCERPTYRRPSRHARASPRHRRLTGTGAPVMISHAAFGGQRPGRCFARMCGAGNAQAHVRRSFRGAAGKAIAGGAGKGRLILVGGERPGQHAALRARQYHALRLALPCVEIRGIRRHQRRSFVRS